jgi:hypothetical protein
MIAITHTGNPGLEIGRMASGLGEAIASGVFKAALHQEAVLRRTIMSERSSSPSSVRTGQLARSYRTRFLARGENEATAGVMSSLEYAAVQNYGGVIRPRVREHLAIPLKRPPVGKWPRDFAKGELFAIRSRKGNLILAKTKGRAKGIEPIFVLKKSVRLSPKGHLERARDAAAAQVQRIMSDAVGDSLEASVGVT